jgi:class 3 adenylate cyclase
VSETRKLAAILVSDIVGYSRLVGADEDRILARLRTLRSDLIDPTIAVRHGRIIKRTGETGVSKYSLVRTNRVQFAQTQRCTRFRESLPKAAPRRIR